MLRKCRRLVADSYRSFIIRINRSVQEAVHVSFPSVLATATWGFSYDQSIIQCFIIYKRNPLQSCSFL